MTADQISEIRPAICEVIKGTPDTCATLEITGHPEKWMQLVDHTINAAYPHGDDPEERVKSQPLTLTGLKVSNWEPNKFATFEMAAFDAIEVAEWIDGYFIHVLNCPPGGYHVDVALEKL